MSLPERAFQWLARILFATVVTLASMYLLLANVAVANQWIVRSPIFGWIPTVVRWFPAVYFVAALMMVAALILRRRSSRVWIFAVAQLALVGCLQYFAVLAHAVPGTTTLVWSLLILGSLIWAAVIDLAAAEPSESATHVARGFSIRGAIIAAAVVVAGHFLLGPAREFFGAGANEVHRWDMLAMLPLSFLGHVALFLLFYVIAVVVSRIAESIWRPEIRPIAALHLIIAIFGFILLRQIVLPSLLFTGWQANLYALVLPFALSFYVAAARTALRDRNETETRRRVREWQVAAVCFAGIAAVAYALSHAVPIFDWNFLFQKLGVFCVWVAVFYLCQRLSRPEPNSILYVAVALVLGIAGMRTFAAVTQSWKPSNFGLTEYMNEATAEYLKRDTSFHALRDLARGSRTNSSNAQFYKYLAENSNVPSSKGGFASETGLVEHLERTPPGASKYLPVRGGQPSSRLSFALQQGGEFHSCHWRIRKRERDHSQCVHPVWRHGAGRARILDGHHAISPAVHSFFRAHQFAKEASSSGRI
jgi:uncharacterized membrane protein